MKSPLLLLTTALALGLTLLPARSEPIPDSCKVGDFATGCQAYSFNRFTVFEAIEKTAQSGGKIIEFYPGQALSKEEPKVRFSHDSPDAVLDQVKAQLAKHGIRAVNYGVVGIPTDEAGARKVFEFAKKLGLYGVTTESDGSIDMIEKMVKEYDICVGFHEHARDPNRPAYRVWDPKYIRDLVKDRDHRIGACADTGHWATSGLEPLECIRILKGRIISLHLKERAVIGRGTPDIVYGTGVSDISAILAELKKEKFKGNISIEYENNWDHSVPDIAQCVGYVRGWSDLKTPALSKERRAKN